MSYEECLKLAQRSAFQDYEFLDNKTVQSFIDLIPPQYSKPRVGPVEQPEGSKMSQAEIAKLSPAAKILNLDDNRKAEAIKMFVGEHFGRKLESVKCDDNNCIFEAVRC